MMTMSKAILTIEDKEVEGEVSITLEFDPVLTDESEDSTAQRIGMNILKQLAGAQVEE